MQEPVRPNLAISLHAPTKELRLELMPIEERYDIKDVIAAAQRYPIPRGGAVTYEYVLLGGVNDQPAHARELVRLLAGSHGKVNLIPLNPAPEIPFAPPTRGGRGRVLPHPLGGARARLRAAPARAGHPRRLRPAPPQARGGPRARPRRLLSASFAARAARLPWAAQIALVLALAAAVLLLLARRPRPWSGPRSTSWTARAAMVESGRLARAALPGRAVLRQARPHLLADGGRLPRLRVLARRRRASSRRWPRWPLVRPRPGWAACSSAGAPPSTGRSSWPPRSSS